LEKKVDKNIKNKVIFYSEDENEINKGIEKMKKGKDNKNHKIDKIKTTKKNVFHRR
jgi:hypothetical protein